MRHFALLASSISVLALAGCGTMSNLGWGDSDTPAQKAQKAETTPAAKAASAPISASATEEKEMAALMGEDTSKPAVNEVYVEPKDVPPPPQMDPSAPAADAAPAPTAEPKIAAEADATLPESKPAPVAGAPKECPAVEVLPDTKSITYFDDASGKPTGEMVARASLADIRGGCEYAENSVVVDIDMIMQGKITDKGRYGGRSDLEAFMTFPYFVAIMAPDGRMVDKKIMATAMRFKPSVNDLDHAEKITQTIPLKDISQGPGYTITIGFQLNREQLDYNRGGSPDRKAAIESAAGKKADPVKEPADAGKPAKPAPKTSETPKEDALKDTPAKPTAAPAAAGSSGAKMKPIAE